MSLFNLRRQMDDLMNQIFNADPFFHSGMVDMPLLMSDDIVGSNRNVNNNDNMNITGSSTGTSLQPLKGQNQGQMQTLSPQLIRCDVHEERDKYSIQAEIPGVPKENIHVNISNGYLTISGEKKEEKQDEQAQDDRIIRRSERRYGSFSRSFRLPTECEPDKIQAKFNNSVLNLTIPKIEKKEPETKEISIM